MAKEIQLTQGKVAIVSDEDYEWLMQWKWCANVCGKKHYARRRHGAKYLFMHREILGRRGLLRPEMVVDHVNGNALDNRIDNLRVCTQSENSVNKAYTATPASSFKGVYKQTKGDGWMAAFSLNNRLTFVGIYCSPVIAAVFANDVIRQHHGAFARLNEIPPHIELLARQIPPRPKWSKSPQLKLAQLEHAERVEKAYSEWLIMKRVTDWQAAIAATARPSATANGSATSAEETAA